MRLAILIAAVAAARAQTAGDWVLSNFSDRLELEVSNPGSHAVDTLAVIPVLPASQVAPRFPGSLAIAVAPGGRPEPLPLQIDDLDGNGTPDEVLVAVKLTAGQTRTIHIYYSATLHDALPWPKRVHASHAFGYNRATAALESEAMGYRTYGGFFLDLQGRWEGRPGLHNSLVGWFGSRAPSTAGRDVIHLGDTLGLGGIFLRAGNDVYRPPVNMPDYAHKPPPDEAPEYRVISEGPLRATVEARMDRWTIGADRVAIRALYSIAAGQKHVDCRFEITPLRLAHAYEAGAGIRHLPAMKSAPGPGRLALEGMQEAAAGPIGLALYYDANTASPSAPLMLKEGGNDCIVFRERLAPGTAVRGRFQLAGVWSGSGVKDLLGYLAGLENEVRGSVAVGKPRHTRTPAPQRLEGEAN